MSRRPTTTTRAAGALPDAAELLRHARMLRRAAGQLEAAARRMPAEPALRLRSEVVRMLSPVVAWGSTDEPSREG
jgi:hypothetical protein